MKRFKLLAAHSAPFVIGIVLSYFFWRSTLLLLIIYLLMALLVVASGKDGKVEAQIFIYGVVAGTVVELWGSAISGYQHWEVTDGMLTIPYWLMVSWGYGFVLMKRIGLIIGAGSPWIAHHD
jgi:hypothetical protein